VDRPVLGEEVAHVTLEVRRVRALRPRDASGTVLAMTRARMLATLTAGAALLVVGALRTCQDRKEPASVSASESDLAPAATRSDATRKAPVPHADAAETIALMGPGDAATPEPPKDVWHAAIGAGPNGFAFEAGREGVLRGPAAPEVTAEGIAILDPIRGELRRFAADGKPLGSFALPSKQVVEAIALSQGQTLLFERGDAGQQVRIVDAAGSVVARLSVPSAVASEDADVSRIVVRGSTVYAETNGGGPLHVLGTVQGDTPKEPATIDGLPTRDDRLLLSAGITNEDEGRAWINASDRATGTHRWTKELRFADEATAVGFLDDDGHGHGWVVVLVGGKPGTFVDAAVCFDVSSGAVLASHAVAVDDPPWQSFRDFNVGPDGTLYALRRERDEARLLAFACGTAPR
jgi:hypothetical protein